MSNRASKTTLDTRELGLIVLARLLGSDDLHYGLWPEGLPVTLHNLPTAQAEYSRLLLSHIPPTAATVLDVGCGTGGLAAKLLDADYRVECLTPSEHLADLAARRLGPEVPIHRCRFEDFEPAGTFDVLLCSESFQYLKLRPALENAACMLGPGGHLLICDFFKRDTPHKSPLGGGHRLSRFHEALADSPFRIVEEVDLTPAAAPNMILFDQLLKDVAAPTWTSLKDLAATRRPLLWKLAAWLFRERIERIETGFLNRELTPELFTRDKAYLLYVLERSW